MGSARLEQQQTSTVSKRGLELLDKVDYRLAQTAEERDEIYQLRYRAYLKEGAIDPNPTGRVTDRHDNSPNSWIFGVHLDGELVSSLRITVASPQYRDCPSMDVFPEFIGPQVDQGKVLIDPTRFVGDPLKANRYPELPYITLRLAFVACAYFDADLGLATVRAEHQAFYRRLFMHQPVSPPRDYPGLKKPIAMMAVDFQAKREAVFARYPFLRSTLFERRMLFARAGEAAPPVLRLAEVPAAPLAASVDCCI